MVPKRGLQLRAGGLDRIGNLEFLEVFDELLGQALRRLVVGSLVSQVLRGLSRLVSTPGTAFGTSRLMMSRCSVSAPISAPLWIAAITPRVVGMLKRLPTP